ncbi:hypothetical protein SPHINGO361_130022 [Sphingomonas sp. EC-HK361]|nr:hypothetical protein SPHINGO361_130022 [Sphingomonas sp. EC-HK361]
MKRNSHALQEMGNGICKDGTEVWTRRDGGFGRARRDGGSRAGGQYRSDGISGDRGG